MRALAGVPRTKLQLVNGIPVTIALEYANGQRMPSRFDGAPDQMRYSLAGNRVAYLPLEVGAMIEELGLQPGQPFTICTYGPRHWEVKPAGDTPRPATQWPTQPPSQQPQRPVQFPQPERPAPPPPPPLPPAARAVVVAPGTAETTKLEHALKTAIQAAHNAEKFGSEIGYTVRFDADAIKSMAITVLINSAEGARR